VSLWDNGRLLIREKVRVPLTRSSLQSPSIVHTDFNSVEHDDDDDDDDDDDEKEEVDWRFVSSNNGTDSVQTSCSSFNYADTYTKQDAKG
jgi:hypothetical protein